MSLETTKKVSIIIPVYNVERYVADCINSVISQTYDHSMIECIIIDDCSLDHSMDVINMIVGQYNGDMTFILLANSENKGQSASRNRGLDIATGEYIYFLDSDDYIYAHTIKKLMKVQDEYPDAEIIIGNTFDEGHNNIIHHISYSNVITDMNYLYCGRRILTVWNQLIKRQIVERIGLRFKEGVYFEDILWNYMIFQSMRKVVICSDITYFYRNNDGGTMQKTRTQKLKECAEDYVVILKECISWLHRPYLVGKSFIVFDTYIISYDYLETVKNKIDNYNELINSLLAIRKLFLQKLCYERRPFLFLMALMTYSPFFHLTKTHFFRRYYARIMALFSYPAIFIDRFFK